MKIFICSIAALTLSVCTMNAQQEADVVNAKKTQVVKKATNTQEVKQTKVVKSEKAVKKAVFVETADERAAKSTEGSLEAKKAARAQQAAKSKGKKVVRKEAKVVKKSESELIKEKKAKKTVKKVIDQ